MPTQMTSRERMMAAMRNQQPDRVPAAPDISNMVPARLTGKSFLKVYYENDPPLWQAYLDAVRYFEMDGLFTVGGIKFNRPNHKLEVTSDVVSRNDERIVVRHTYHTPAGDLWNETTYYHDNPPTTTRKWIKNLKEDMPKLRYFFSEIDGFDDTNMREMAKLIGENGVIGYHYVPTGLHDLFHWFDDGMAGASIAYYEDRDTLDELVEWITNDRLQEVKLAIEAKPDYVHFGCSGMWTLNTPEAFYRYCLPPIQKVAKWGREAGVIMSLHCCGKERELVEICATQTDLDCINPLEVPPMGDCDLAEIKEKFGDKIALMGNLHTTEVMLRGTVAQVEAACRQAIDDGAKNGGFILSTGDQCGRDTPDENIRAMVRVAREYGKY